jgi:hypothetical protein
MSNEHNGIFFINDIFIILIYIKSIISHRIYGESRRKPRALARGGCQVYIYNWIQNYILI